MYDKLYYNHRYAAKPDRCTLTNGDHFLSSMSMSTIRPLRFCSQLLSVSSFVNRDLPFT